MLAPKLHPIKEKCWECKQSKCSQVPKCPRRMLAIGPSGSGKSVALQNMILDIYKNCFSRIYNVSPSIDIDKISTGEYWLATKAKELNLVDDLMTSDEYLMKLHESGNNIYAIEYKKEQTLMNKFSIACNSLKNIFSTKYNI